MKKESSLTCYSGNDGGGAQLQRIMSVASLCHFLGITFVFTPIREIDFYPNKISKNTWIKEWNNLINFKNFYKENTNYQLIEEKLFIALIGMIFKKNSFAISNAHKFADSFPNEYDRLISSTGLNIHSVSTIPLAIHLRRPAFAKLHPTYGLELKRQISLSRFLFTINLIRTTLSLEEINGVVFIASHDSETKLLEEKFTTLVFDYQTDVFNSIKLMSSAKVLVVAHSSMSYLAALFNNNIVFYYEDFWHFPKKNWIPIK